MNQYEWYALFLEEYLKDLETEQMAREIADNLNKWLKKNEPDIWKKPNPWNETQRCTKCGLKLEGVMGYCCPNVGCPTGLGPVMCMADTTQRI